MFKWLIFTQLNFCNIEFIIRKCHNFTLSSFEFSERFLKSYYNSYRNAVDNSIIDPLFFSIFEFYPCPFPAFLHERSVLAGWRRSNTFPVPSNGVGALSDAAVEVLIHTLYSPTLVSRLQLHPLHVFFSPSCSLGYLASSSLPFHVTLHCPSSSRMTRTRTWQR